MEDVGMRQVNTAPQTGSNNGSVSLPRKKVVSDLEGRDPDVEIWFNIICLEIILGMYVHDDGRP